MWHPDLDPNFLKELINPHREKMSLIGITYIRPVAVPAVHNAVQQLLLLRCTHFSHHQCCGSGAGIRCLFEPLDPGSEIGKNLYPDPGCSYFRELKNNFLG
jgi:hypothetical protein